MFSNCLTPAQIKSEYRTLAMKNHPDLGGSTRVMQKINAAYLVALKFLDGFIGPKDASGKSWAYKYNETIEKIIIEKVNELLKVKLPSNVEITIIGVWIWVEGIARDDLKSRAKVKGLGLKWHSKKLCWYFKPYKSRTRHSGASLGTLAAIYGASKVEDEGKKGGVPLPITA